MKSSGLRWVCLMLLVPVPRGATRLGVAVFECPCSVGALLRPAGQTAQEDTRLGTTVVTPRQTLVAPARDRCGSRFRLC